MNFFVEWIQAIIFLMFPLFLYSFFENMVYPKDISIFLKISLFASSFLYSLFVPSFFLSIFIHIPLLIAYLKGYKLTYVILNFVIIEYYVIIGNIDISFLMIEYLALYLFLYFGKSKLNVFVLLTSYFYSFYVSYYQGLKLFSSLFFLLLGVLLFYYFLTLIFKYITFSYKNRYTTLEDSYRSYLFKFIHEVKNPIAVCQGYLEMLHGKRMKNSKKTRQYLEVIDKEIKESLGIMEDYLVFGRFQVNLEYMDINLLLQDICHSFSRIYKNGHIDIDFDYDEEEIIILGDYNKLKQVLVNILKNSIEAKKENEELHIKIRLLKEEESIKIEVLDNGIGIKNAKNVGKEFYTTKINGTGLGVNFSKTIISLHKGKIKYMSEESVGTKVLITLPLAEV